MEERMKEEIIIIEDPDDLAAKAKQKPNREKIKYNKFSKVMIYIMIVVLIMTLLICLLEFMNENFSNWLWTKVNNPLSSVMYGIMQNFASLSSYGLIILASIFGLLVLLFLIFFIVYRKNIQRKSLFANILMPMIVVVVLFANISIYFTLSNASHRGINEIFMKEFKGEVYGQEDLANVIDYFKNRIVIYSEAVERKGGDINEKINSYEIALDDVKNLAIKYDFLSGDLPSKIRVLNEYDLKTSNYAKALTKNYTIGLDTDNITDLNKIFTLTHEFCHVKGIMRESDANYCAFLSGYNSNSDISKYSMYLNIMPYLLNALKDEELYKSIKNEFGNICIESGYSEICNLYSKDINRYIEGSDTIELNTYSLNIYKEYKEELKQYLIGLKNRFDITIISEGKQISIEDANKLIDDEEEIELYLKGSINEDKYYENMKYINTIADYFPHLFLSNSKETKTDYSSYDYLKPYASGTYATLTEKYPEFSYERSVRSILEYFDKYILN